MNEYEIRKLFPNASASTLRRNARPSAGVEVAKQEPNPGDEPMAKTPRESVDPVRRHVWIESYRTHLLDKRNLWEHYVTDALIAAGILFDDSEAWCEIHVKQVQVGDWRDEHTTVKITPWP